MGGNKRTVKILRREKNENDYNKAIKKMRKRHKKYLRNVDKDYNTFMKERELDKAITKLHDMILADNIYPTDVFGSPILRELCIAADKTVPAAITKSIKWLEPILPVSSLGDDKLNDLGIMIYEIGKGMLKPK